MTTTLTALALLATLLDSLLGITVSLLDLWQRRRLADVARKAVTLHRRTPDGRTLASRRIVAHIAGRNIETVAKWCRPVACDVVNRTPLYDADESLAALATRPVASR